MKKCLLGIAMLLTASFSFAQVGFTITPSSVTFTPNDEKEFVISVNVSEELVGQLMSGYFALILPEGMEFSKAYGKGAAKKYYEVVSGSSFDDYDASIAITSDSKYPNVLIFAYYCYYEDLEDIIGYTDDNKEIHRVYGWPYEDGEQLLKFKIKATDKIQTGDFNVVMGDKPWLDGNPGEDPRFVVTGLEGGAFYPEAVECPVTLKVPFAVGESGYATLCWPVALDFSGTGLTAQIATGLDKGTVLRENVEKVAAATPVIIMADKGDYFLKTTKDDVQASSGNLLKGTATGTYTATTNTFALASKNEGVGFYRCNAGVVIPQYKAYIESDSSVDESFLFEETTGISSVEAEAGNTDAYTISGVKVKNPTQKGIYIINGKKVVK